MGRDNPVTKKEKKICETKEKKKIFFLIKGHALGSNLPLSKSNQQPYPLSYEHFCIY